MVILFSLILFFKVFVTGLKYKVNYKNIKDSLKCDIHKNWFVMLDPIYNT